MRRGRKGAGEKDGGRNGLKDRLKMRKGDDEW